MLNLAFCVIVVKLMVWNCKENLFEILEQYVSSREQGTSKLLKKKKRKVEMINIIE